MNEYFYDNFENHEYLDYSEGGGFESMEERMLERRAEKLYHTLMEKGEFSKVDKAKHNIQYRNYLLENYEDDNRPY